MKKEFVQEEEEQREYPKNMNVRCNYDDDNDGRPSAAAPARPKDSSTDGIAATDGGLAL